MATSKRDKDISRFTPNDFEVIEDEVEDSWLELLANHLVKLCPDYLKVDAEPDIEDYYNYDY